MDSDYFLHLTDAGRKVAKQIFEKHRFFTDRLIEAGVDPVTAEKDACRMEHVISRNLSSVCAMSIKQKMNNLPA